MALSRLYRIRLTRRSVGFRMLLMGLLDLLVIRMILRLALLLALAIRLMVLLDGLVALLIKLVG